jgi:hypothetical protein
MEGTILSCVELSTVTNELNTEGASLSCVALATVTMI